MASIKNLRINGTNYNIDTGLKSANNNNKLYVLGTTSQTSENTTSYSNNKVYIEDGVLTATAFSGSLIGNADTATVADVNPILNI
jgi:hypothetical protein